MSAESNVTITNSTNQPSDEVDPHDLWWMILIVVGGTIVSAFFNGLNLGVMGLDSRYLDLLTKGPFESKKQEHEAELAKKILPIRKKTNFLLTTILLWIVMANTLVAQYFGNVLGGLAGFFVSTFAIVIASEIIPQAICSRFGLAFGARVVYVLYFCIAVTAIIAYPISAILDKVIGEDDSVVLSKSRMKKLFEMYEKENLLRPSERKILSTTLELQEKTAGQIMTPLSKAFMLEVNSIIDNQLLKKIYTEGYSRIPIYEGQQENIVGVLMSRDLILLSNESTLLTIKQLSSVLIRDVILIDHQTKLEPILSYFKKGDTHMGIVTMVVEEEGKDPEFRKVGILTLEDIVEEILSEEIHDERDMEAIKGERRKLKEKHYLLFTDNRAKNVLSQVEIQAICEYLEGQVKIFDNKKMKREFLEELVHISEVHEIESAAVPFAHNNKNQENFNILNKHQKEIQQEFHQHLIEEKTYNEKENNKMKKKEGKHEEKSEDDDEDEQKKHDEIDEEQMQNMQASLKKETKKTLNSSDNDENVNEEMNIPEEDMYEDLKKEHQQAQEQQILESDVSPVLYIRSLPSKDFYLILQGNIVVSSGQEGFLIELGPFNYLGMEALIQRNYVPDFSAQVNNYAKVLRIRQIDYLNILFNLDNYNK